MFNWLKNIWYGIKDFFGFFGSVVGYIVTGFGLIVSIIKYPLAVIDTFASSFPSIIMICAMVCLLVWIIRTITGRGE